MVNGAADLSGASGILATARSPGFNGPVSEIKPETIVLSALLMGCSFESPEQAAGRCRTEGIAKLPPISGPQATVTSAFLLDEYAEACMKGKGFRRDQKGEWGR